MLFFFEALPGGGEESPPDFDEEVAVLGRSDCISRRASLMRLRRPCSATLCDVRLLVRPVESESG